MSKPGDDFMKPYSQRDCPDGIPQPVWAAFARCATNHSVENWQAYLAVHHLYYDESGTLRPQPLEPSLF